MAKPSRRRTQPPAPTPGPATLTDAAAATFATGTAFASEWLAIAGTQAAAMTGPTTRWVRMPADKSGNSSLCRCIKATVNAPAMRAA